MNDRIPQQTHQSVSPTTEPFPSHLWASQWRRGKEKTQKNTHTKKKQGLIDPKRHFIHPAPPTAVIILQRIDIVTSPFARSLLSRPDELCRLYLDPKQGSSLTATQHFARRLWLPADLSGDKKCQRADRIWTLCPWRGVPGGLKETKHNKNPLKQTFRLPLNLPAKLPVLIPKTQGAILFYFFLDRLKWVRHLGSFYSVMWESSEVTSDWCHNRALRRQSRVPVPGSTPNSIDELNSSVTKRNKTPWTELFLLAHWLSFHNITVTFKVSS